MARLILPTLVLALSACDATFTDLTVPAESAADVGFGGPDAGPGSGVERTIATGTWMGRNGDPASGSAAIVQRANGAYEVVFGADFDAARIPAPVVVLSSRESIGRNIDAAQGDLDLGVRTSERGEQSYRLPDGDGGRRYLFVFCLTFGIETARAVLSEVP